MLSSVQFVFLSLNLFYGSIGYLVCNHEKIVPAFVLRVVRNGAFGYKGKGAQFMTKLYVSKRYGHLYVFSSFLGISNLVYMLLVYFCGFQVNVRYVRFLQAFNGITSPVSVLASMTAVFLLTLQCIKRLYESYFIQVFAKTSQVCITHYIVGLIYYLAVHVAIIGQAPLFCGDNNRDTLIWADSRSIMLIPGIPLFLWAWYEQHQSNKILADLRKDKKSGQVVTEEYRVPHGRLFESISSPHRLCEIVLYAALFTIMQTKTVLFIFLWVLTNQVLSSVLAHKWYKDTFKNYPTKRYAVFKSIL